MKLVSTAIVITIGLVLAGSLLAPTIAEAQDSLYVEGSYSNVVEDVDQLSMSAITSESSHTLNVDSTGITIDSDTISYWEDTTYQNLVLLTNTMFVGVKGSGVIAIITSTGTVSATATSFTAIISGGNITYSINSEDSVSTTYTDGYIVDPDGDHISCDPSQTKYYDDESFGQARYNSNNGYVVYLNGVAYQNGTALENGATVTSTAVSDTDDQVYTLTSIKIANVTMTTNAVMEKTADYRYTDDEATVNLYGAILPITIVALVIVGVRLLLTRND